MEKIRKHHEHLQHLWLCKSRDLLSQPNEEPQGYKGRQETRATSFAAMAQNLRSQLGDLGNCCHKVLPGK